MKRLILTMLVGIVLLMATACGGNSSSGSKIDSNRFNQVDFMKIQRLTAETRVNTRAIGYNLYDEPGNILIADVPANIRMVHWNRDSFSSDLYEFDINFLVDFSVRKRNGRLEAVITEKETVGTRIEINESLKIYNTFEEWFEDILTYCLPRTKK